MLLGLIGLNQRQSGVSSFCQQEDPNHEPAQHQRCEAVRTYYVLFVMRKLVLHSEIMG